MTKLFGFQPINSITLRFATGHRIFELDACMDCFPWCEDAPEPLGMVWDGSGQLNQARQDAERQQIPVRVKSVQPQRVQKIKNESPNLLKSVSSPYVGRSEAPTLRWTRVTTLKCRR
jgi:hypothetical protein